MSEINTRKRGTKWEYRFEAAPVAGKRNQITKGGFRTKKEALEVGAEALARYNSAGYHFTPSEISFSDYLDYWMQEYCTINLKDTTCYNYQKKITLHIKPALGEYKLKALTPAVMQSFLNVKFNEGYSRNSLMVLKGVLSGCLGYAVEPLAFIQNNPMSLVKVPSSRAKAIIPTRKKEKLIVVADQMEAIFKRFPEGHSCYIPIQLAYRCGLRLGEAFALAWDDINFDSSTIDVNKQVQMDEKSKMWTFTAPKYDSFRKIKADSILLSILKSEKEKQEKAKEYYGVHYSQICINEKKQLCQNGDPIGMVNSREDGTYIQPRVTQHLSRIIHFQLGFKEFDYHSLRHTHATILLEAGANPVDVQHRLGHKNIDTTMNIYAHCTLKMQNDTIDILEKIK